VPRVRTLVVILAGGAGGRLELLTRTRAKPAVAFAGTHRLIDFPLSNCRNAGLSNVWIAQQFNPISLSDHLANGRPWDLDRTIGGLLVLQPRLGHDDREGFQESTADSLWRNAPIIREFDPEALVVLSAAAVYSQDYGALVEEHMASDAGVTMVATEVDPQDAGRYGVVQVDDDGAVVDYPHKPDTPATNLVANEVFVFRPKPLWDVLEDVADRADDDGLEDLGEALLPRLVEAGGARESRFEDYWRDIGTVDAYSSAHQDLLGDVEEDDRRDERPSAERAARSAGRFAVGRVRVGGALFTAESILGPPRTPQGRAGVLDADQRRRPVRHGPGPPARQPRSARPGAVRPRGGARPGPGSQRGVNIELRHLSA
jgi:glucose-1-phosphate adenylyltransferase